MNEIALLILILIHIYGQTVMDDYPSPTFFDVMVHHDGRLVANIRGGDYYGEGDPYHDVYRNFIEINKDTGTLLIVFGVAELDLVDNGFLKSVTLKSEGVRTGPPNDATFPKPDWFTDNMVIWFDEMEHAFVLIYQGGCYSCLEKYYGGIYSHWLDIPNLDATNQTVWRSMTYDDGLTWHNTMQILKDQVVNPHVQFQVIEGLGLNEDGFSKEILLPVHHLDINLYDNNYQMLWRMNRAIDPEDGSWRMFNLTENSTEGEQSLNAHIQSTIVRRNSGDPTLIAFLRDRYGKWVYRTESTDDGRSWSVQEATPLPNPDLMLQAIALNNGHIMLVHNPQQSYISVPTADRNYNSHMLSVSISTDGGLSWKYSRMLEYAYDGKFLYPAGIQDPGCANVYLTYSVETYEPIQGCVAWKNSLLFDHYKNCLTRAVSLTYIKFTVLSEDWVIDPHGWDINFQGCRWKIAPELKQEISQMKINKKDGFNTRSVPLVELTQTLSSKLVNKSIIPLAILVGLFATWSVVLLLYTISANNMKVASQ